MGRERNPVRGDRKEGRGVKVKHYEGARESLWLEIEKREKSSRFKRAGQIRFGEFRDKALSGSELSRAVGCLPRPRCSFFPVAVVLFRRISPTLS